MTARRRGTSICLLALLAGSLNASIIGTSRAEFRASFALIPNGRVVVQNLYGDVQITAWDRDEVLVQAIKHSADPHRLNDAQIVVDSSSGLVSIHTQYTGSDAAHPARVGYHRLFPPRPHLDNLKLTNASP